LWRVQEEWLQNPFTIKKLNPFVKPQQVTTKTENIEKYFESAIKNKIHSP